MTDTSPAVRAYQQWCDGDVDEVAALRAMQAALDNADRLISAGEGQRSLWRKRIEEVVYQLGGKAKIDGLAEYRITEPYQTVTYDRKEIEKVLHEALEAGDIGTAHALEAARKVSERAGTLMIRREKK